MKQLQEKKSMEKSTTVVECSDDDDEEDEGPRLAIGEIKNVLERLSAPLNNQETKLLVKLKERGVFDAVEEGRVSFIASARVLRCFSKSEFISRRSITSVQIR